MATISENENGSLEVSLSSDLKTLEQQRNALLWQLKQDENAKDIEIHTSTLDAINKIIDELKA